MKVYKLGAKKTVSLSIISSLTYATTDEIHQLFVAGRSCELRDVIIDTIASGLGIAIFFLIYHYRSTKKKKQSKHIKYIKKYIKKNKAKLYKWASRAITTTLIFTYFIAILSIISTRIIPIKYLGLCIIISSILVLGITIAKLRGKLSPKKDMALVIASLVMIIINLIAISGSIATYSFFNNIQQRSYMIEEYSLIAKKDNKIVINKSSKQAIGILSTDINNNLVKNELKNKINPEYKQYPDLTSLTVALDSREVEMAVVKNSHLLLLQENYEKFYQSIEVILNFQIKLETTSKAATLDITKPFIIYISGIDTYGGIDTVSRSDVNILAVINPLSHKILLVTTPRDYYVQLNSTTGIKDKLTHSGIYGVDMSVKTLQDLYNTPIDYYLRVNFSSLTGIVDTIGGIDVNSAYDFTVGNDSFKQGINHLDGRQALVFSRERHSFAEGDRTRGQNQERVIESIIYKLNNPGNLVKYQKIMESLSGIFQTNMNPADMTSIINKQLNDMSKWQIESISVDGIGSYKPTYSMGNLPLYVMEPDIDSLTVAKQKILEYQLSH